MIVEFPSWKFWTMVDLSTFWVELYTPHHRVEFFPREVEYSTFRVEIQDHHFKWNFPPFSVTVQARGLHVTMYADDVQYYDFYQPQLTALLGTRLAECGKATNLLMGNQPAVTPHQVAAVAGNFVSACER
jgi:hypothetical protein